MNSGAGELHLIPVTLGDDNVSGVLPQGTRDVVAGLDYFIVENAKSARAFLKHLPHPLPLSELAVETFDKDGTAERAAALLQPVRAGRSAAVLSEAGCPAVADPGARLVEAAHAAGIRVRPHVGPSALLLALMASGFDGQHFEFHGYLPVPSAACRNKIVELERESRARGTTQIFIETPYRNDALLRALLDTCADETRLCVASGLTLPDETVSSATVREWRRRQVTIGRQPTVFLLFSR